MDSENLGQLATRTRFMREAGIALLVASGILVLFIFVPLEIKTRVPAAAILAALVPPNAFATLSISGEAAIVFDLVTREVLFSKNSDAQLPLASLTKLLTVLAAVHELPLDLPITISALDEQVDSPHRFRAGDTLTLRDMARLTLTASLNDGASAIISAVASRMATSTEAALNGVAATIGLSSTYAVNGNGLDVSPLLAGGYGSARDMALLAGALVHDAPDVALATTLEKTSATTASGKHYEILNTNPTVTNAPRLLLSKTGFTDLAHGNLVLVFDASINHPIAVVVLDSTEEARFTDGNALIAATLAHLANIASL